MAFGILESTDPSPPGTSILENLATANNSAEIVLVPEPSKSPNDPLNWSRARKETLFAILVFGSILTGVIGPVLAPGFSIVAANFGVGFTQITLLNGSLVMGLGISSYICASLAPIYGKRLIYLFTTTLFIVTCIWAAAARSYNSLLAARCFQGLSMGGFFALSGTITINDVWFVHERGLRVGLWNMASIAAINIAPIISGYVIVGLGWRWSFWMLAISYGVLLVLVAFFMPETSFERSRLVGGSSWSLSAEPAISSSHVMDESSEKKTIPTADTSIPELGIATGVTSIKVHAWKRILGVENFEIRSGKEALRNLIAPLMLLRAPVVIWSCCEWSVIFTWLIIQASMAQQIFGAPPYNLDSIHVGIFIGCAPLAGAVTGTFAAGLLSDAIAKTMSIRNNGIYEPEFRLLIMIPFMITWCVGIFGLGAAIRNEMSLTVCGVFLAILNLAVGIGCTGIVTYTNDVCGSHAAESFGLTMLIKSAFAFGLTFILNDYYIQVGPMNFMATWGGLAVGVTLFTIPLYVYGKRSRAWTHRHGIL